MILPKNVEKRFREKASVYLFGLSEVVLDTIFQTIATDDSDATEVIGHLPADHPLLVKLNEIAYSDDAKLLMAKCDIDSFDVRYTVAYDDRSEYGFLIIEVDTRYSPFHSEMIGGDLEDYLDLENVCIGFGGPPLSEEPEFREHFVQYLNDYGIEFDFENLTPKVIRSDDLVRQAAMHALYEINDTYGAIWFIDLFANARVIVNTNEHSF